MHFTEEALADSDVLGVDHTDFVLDAGVVEVLIRVQIDVDHMDEGFFGILCCFFS